MERERRGASKENAREGRGRGEGGRGLEGRDNRPAGAVLIHRMV